MPCHLEACSDVWCAGKSTFADSMALVLYRAPGICGGCLGVSLLKLAPGSQKVRSVVFKN